ncbi:hypothetical protein OH76DRAFT_1561543 [Lentinus brumalis]|uniref:Uncharacterized protein n=1 Tax=Lentinus brumalis TaxID=2498619 RepID=A0A371CMH8_9APHY|nr:hypothetical protein OH76DRAFT_1561543 [Polyporus brumalis]
MAQAQYHPHIVYGTPPQLDWPPERVYKLWWTDEVLRHALSAMPEPTKAIVYSSKTLQELRDSLRLSDTRIAQLEERLKQLSGRVSLEVEKDLYGARISRKLVFWRDFPIRQLPIEILATIFRYVVWSVPGPFEANHTRRSLTATCRHFREVAIADQNLWNAIWFLDVYPWQRSLAFLERSGTSLLDVRFGDKEHPFRSGKEYPPMTVAHLDHLLDALLAKISQIRVLLVRFESMELVEHFMKRFATAGPPTLLERYEVHRTSAKPYLWPPEQAKFPVPISVHPTPKLRWLCLDGVSIDFSKLHPTNLHTVNLRRMTLLSCPTSEKFSEILSAASGLFNLGLSAAGPRWTPVQPVARIRRVVMPNLRDLLIGDMGCPFSIFILNHFHAPRVMVLSLVHLRGQDYSAMLAAMTGLFPELQLLSLDTLYVTNSDETTRAAVLWLESMPCLKMLKVNGAKRFILDVFGQDPTQYWTQSQTDTYIRAWKEKHGDREVVRPVLLPNLEYLQAMGRPFKTAYTPDVHLKTIPAEELEKIRDSVGELEIMDGMKPPSVELDIHRGMADTVDKSV